MNKLAEVTLFFWIMKICATTLGETAGDLLAQTLKVGYGLSSLILLSLFVISLVAQLRAKQFYPLLYWAVILTTSTAGTTLSDYMDRTLALGYLKGSLILVSLLLSTLAFWKIKFGSVSVTRVKTVPVEFLYWMTILFSNTLGTALGDFLADDSGLGFAGGAALISSVIAVIVLLYFFTRVSRVALFWSAFVLTRPWGATVGDFLTKSKEQGGLDLGTVGSSLCLLVILLAVMGKAYGKRTFKASSGDIKPPATD